MEEEKPKTKKAKKVDKPVNLAEGDTDVIIDKVQPIQVVYIFYDQWVDQWLTTAPSSPGT